MTFKSISYWLWFIILAGLGLALIQIPLFNLLAFESCAVLTIGIAFAGAYISVTRLHHLRRSLQILSGSSHQIVITLFWRTFGGNLTLLIVPLVILSLNALARQELRFVRRIRVLFSVAGYQLHVRDCGRTVFRFLDEAALAGIYRIPRVYRRHVSYVRLQPHIPSPGVRIPCGFRLLSRTHIR